MTAPPAQAEAIAADPALAVIVVADNRTRTRQLRRLLSGPGFVVPAEACSAEEAEQAVVTHQPGAVLIDLDPEAGGIEAIERIMGTRPTPIVVCGVLAEHAQAALAAGAVDVIGALDALPTSPQYLTAVRRHLRVASRVRVITHPRNRLRARSGQRRAGWEAAPVPPRPRDATSHGEPPADVLPEPSGPMSWPAEPAVRIVVIGASTGGPPALATILGDLPADLPVPVLVVQHMADGFVEGLATWLDSLSPLPVVLAEHGRRLMPGTVYVAPAGANTVLRAGLRVELREPLAGQFHVPGVDAAFGSVATACGHQALGVLLTGMGRDGAAGLRRMRDAGAPTVGQDEPTSVVWGMPGAALALGAVEQELALPDVAEAIVAVVRRPARTAAHP